MHLQKFISVVAILILIVVSKSSFAENKKQVLGIDVSLHQSKIDWERVQKDGVGFSIIRATMGEKGVDEYFDKNWKDAKRDGLVRGAYHFFMAQKIQKFRRNIS